MIKKPEDAISKDNIDWSQTPVMFRCTNQCFNQFSPDRLKKDDADFARCPVCDGYVRQLKDDLHDTYV